MATGTVKWFSDEKGFGFVTPDEGGKDLFVHHTGINGNGFRTLAEGARVSYDAENGDKGPKAVNVTVIYTWSNTCTLPAALTPRAGTADRWAERRIIMIRLLCRSCLRLWSMPAANHRASCPHCGGALMQH